MSNAIPDEQLSLVHRLRLRATIRRQIPTRKSVQEGKPDRIADLLEEAATALQEKDQLIKHLQETLFQKWWRWMNT